MLIWVAQIIAQITSCEGYEHILHEFRSIGLHRFKLRVAHFMLIWMNKLYLLETRFMNQLQPPIIGWLI